MLCHQKYVGYWNKEFFSLIVGKCEKTVQIVCKQYSNINIDIICFVWHPFYIILITGPKENN